MENYITLPAITLTDEPGGNMRFIIGIVNPTIPCPVMKCRDIVLKIDF